MNSFVVAYLLTNLIEFFPLNYLVGGPIRWKAVVLVAINSVTVPLVWFVLPFFYQQYFIALFFIEVFVVVLEALLIKQLLKQAVFDSFKISLAMNVPSAIVGAVI